MMQKKPQYNPERKRLEKVPETIYTTVILILAAVIGYLLHWVEKIAKDKADNARN